MLEIRPDSTFTLEPPVAFRIFLAGSIEMGKAERWQDRVIEGLQNLPDLVIYNPRRHQWDPSWSQNKDFGPFRSQVDWELDRISQSDLIVFYFDPSTVSPVTLLEFGLCMQTKDIVVCCPEGYYRKGNIDIVCERYSVRQVDTLSDLVLEIKERLK